MTELGRLPQPGDNVALPVRADAEDDQQRVLDVTVRAVARRVPASIELRWSDSADSSGAAADTTVRGAAAEEDQA